MAYTDADLNELEKQIAQERTLDLWRFSPHEEVFYTVTDIEINLTEISPGAFEEQESFFDGYGTLLLGEKFQPFTGSREELISAIRDSDPPFANYAVKTPYLSIYIDEELALDPWDVLMTETAWHKLQHAGGTAINVPQHLQAFKDGDNEQQQAANDFLAENFLQPRQWFSATTAVALLLVELPWQLPHRDALFNLKRAIFPILQVLGEFAPNEAKEAVFDRLLYGLKAEPVSILFDEDGELASSYLDILRTWVPPRRVPLLESWLIDEMHYSSSRGDAYLKQVATVLEKLKG